MIPTPQLEPRLDDNALVVIAAADHVAQLLPNPTVQFRAGFTVTERLDGVTLAALKEMGRQVI
jgi:hypothetical protein